MAAIHPSLCSHSHTKPLGSPVELLHEIIDSTQVGIPDLLHQNEVVLRQDLGGQAQSCSPLARSCSGGTPVCLLWAAKAPRLAVGGQQGPQGQGGGSWLGAALSVQHPPTAAPREEPEQHQMSPSLDWGPARVEMA